MADHCYSCRKKIEDIQERLHGLHVECFQREFGLSKKVDFEDLAIKHQASGGDPRDKKSSKLTTSFFHGKFRKYSASLGGQSYIMKVKERDYEELPATEYLCNQIAVQLGIPVPKFSLIEFQESITTFVTRNFMQDYTASNLIHMYHFTSSEADWNCEFILNKIAETAGKLPYMEKFIEICLFDALIGNNDRHGRNLGIIQQRQKYILAPFYDNPSNLGIEVEALLGAVLEPRGSIATNATDQPTMKDYVTEFKRLDYGYISEKFFQKVNKQKKAIKNLIDGAFLTTKRKTALRNLMNRRYKELVENV